MICEANEGTNDKNNVDNKAMARMYMVVVFFWGAWSQGLAELLFKGSVSGKETSPSVL